MRGGRKAGPGASARGQFSGMPTRSLHARGAVADDNFRLRQGGWHNALCAQPDAWLPVPAPAARGPSQRPPARGWGCAARGRSPARGLRGDGRRRAHRFPGLGGRLPAAGAMTLRAARPRAGASRPRSVAATAGVRLGVTPRLCGLCGKPPSASSWLLVWLSNVPPTTCVSWASPVGLVAVFARPISLAARRRSWPDPPC
jgi:hypothetical protein